MVPRALFGGIESTSKSMYSSDSQLLLSRPSVNGALWKHTRKIATRVPVILFPVYSIYFILSVSVYCFQYVAAVVFFFWYISVVLFLVQQVCVFFF